MKRIIIPFLTLTSLFLLLTYSRFVNIGWGLPYPFHPDERNIANAIQNLTCHMGSHEVRVTSYEFWKTCLNPHFFAYGQLSIYGAYILILISRLATHLKGQIQFDEAIFAIRFISATASMAAVWFAVKTVKLFSKSYLLTLISYILLIFCPAAIQFAHYGTTESLLMLFYTILVYLSVRFIREEIPLGLYAGASGFIVGMAAGAKISSLIFTVLPLVLFVFPRRLKTGKRTLVAYLLEVKYRAVSMFLFGVTLVSTVLATSFYTFIDRHDALGSLQYESDVALGRLEVFYTRTFAHTTPVIFQFTNVFPFALGILMTVLFVIGFIILPWKKEHNVLRLAFLLYFLPTAFTFTKWTRFMAPVFPLMIIVTVLTVFRLYEIAVEYINENKRIDSQIRDTVLFGSSLVFAVVVLVLIIPGFSYLTIYQTQDVRYKASDWIYKNVKPNAYILEETANVVDLPIPDPKMVSVPATAYEYYSFNFYDLDGDPLYQPQLQHHVDNADYIFIPSRRIFANHTCLGKTAEVCRILRKKYPILNNYYDALFSGQLGFKEVATFSSYPRIELFGKTLMEFPDEVAEETWTVFDHPVIRIYKRIQGLP